MAKNEKIKVLYPYFFGLVLVEILSYSVMAISRLNCQKSYSTLLSSTFKVEESTAQLIIFGLLAEIWPFSVFLNKRCKGAISENG